MRRLFVSFLVFSLAVASCAVSQPTGDFMSGILTTPWEDRSLFKAGLVDSAQAFLDEMPDASIYHLEFNIADDMKHISGREEVRYTNTEGVALNEVQFRLFPNILGGKMTVSNLTADEQSIKPTYELRRSLLIVPLSTALEPGQSVSIKMDFAVTVTSLKQSYSRVLTYLNDILTLAHAYPVIAVYDDDGWDTEIPPQSGDVAYADASLFLVKVTAPKELTIVTSGHTVSSETGEQVQILSVASGPARDFYLAASPGYKKISQTFGEVTINSYAAEGFQEGAQSALDIASRALDIFSTRYTPFPYKEFDIVETPTIAQGFEYPGVIAISSRIYDLNTRDVFEILSRDAMEMTVAHEVGHQWFYNLVGNDQLDDPWLDESLTQFATLQYYTDEYGPGGAHEFRNFLEGRWHNIPNGADIPIGLPVDEYGQAYSGIVYGRGPFFFVALKGEMGTESFDAFLKEYTETLSWDIATPAYLQSLAEKHCTCDLDALFNEWIYHKAR